MNTTRLRHFVALVVCVGISAFAAGPEDSELTNLQTQAVAFYQAGHYKAAVPLYRRLFEAQPDNPGALKDYLMTLWLAEHYSEAAEAGAALARLSDNDPEAWFIYARSLLAIGRKEEALAAFQRCRKLVPDQKEVQLGEARAAAALRDYTTALPLLVDLQRRYPEFKEVYPELARLQQALGSFGDAAKNWALAADYFPAQPDYRMHHAETLYYSGEAAEARKRLQVLAERQPPYWPAIDFLVDDAVARGDLSRARQLLEKNLTLLQMEDEPRLLILTRLYMQQKSWTKAEAALDRLRTLNPQSGKGLILKAVCFYNQGRYPAAIGVYDQVLGMNPSSLASLTGKAEAENAAGHPELAVQTMERARAADPSDPYLLLRQTQYLYESGDPQRHKDMLLEWISGHPQAPLPILLYHGLTPLAQDPLLAYALHRTTATFDDHLRVLKAMGFHAVTAQQVNAWVHDGAVLPEHPVFITFDDARLDSLHWGDPLLKKYGFNAAMFIPLINVEGYFSKFATWKELQPYQDSGRWDMESHGDQAHDHIVIDPVGHRGLFLLNRQWLSSSQRLESAVEWEERIRRDHASVKRKIESHLGHRSRAFSFPEGDFGQEDASNSPEAAPVNLKLAREAYESAYHEDEYGFNLSSRDPMLFTRYEPPAGTTGRALLNHMTDEPPAVLMVRSLLRRASWEGRSHEAYGWLSDLQGRGVSQSCLLSERARIRLAEGDRESARRLAGQAMQEDPSDENRKFLDEIDQTERGRWEGRFTYQEDNKTRISRRFLQDLGYWRAHAMDWSVHHLYGTYSEGGIPTVTEQGGGAAVARDLGVFHRLTVEATGHFFSGAVKNTYSLTGDLQSAWADDFSTELEGGRSIYDTARALQANVIMHYAQGVLRFQPGGDWRASVKARGAGLSDGNDRETGVLDVGRHVRVPHLWIVGRATLDTMDHVSPNYYSPQQMRSGQLGFEYGKRLHKGVDFSLLYLPGVGQERGTSAEFVQDIDTHLSVSLTRSLSIRPSITVVHTPTYHRNTFAGDLVYRF